MNLVKTSGRFVNLMKRTVLNSSPILFSLAATLQCRFFGSNADYNVIDQPDSESIQLPKYVDKIGETDDNFKARLVYQSRKRGTLEIGLLLSTFAARYIPIMTKEQLLKYDKLINKPSNDWDIYYWITGSKPSPLEYENDVMDMIRLHAQNREKELRITQPELFKKY